MRKPRTVINRLLDRALYKCERCGRKIHRRRSLFTVLGRYCECPKCGGRDLNKLASKDRVDAVTHNPFRRLLKLVGAPLYHCTFCRYQFRDWRRLDPNMVK